jgi:hypothetical protein
MNSFINTLLLFLLVSTAIIPAGIDATLCFESDDTVDVHLSECSSNSTHSESELHKNSKNECTDVELTCLFEISVNSVKRTDPKSQIQPTEYTPLFSYFTPAQRLKEAPPLTIAEYQNCHSRLLLQLDTIRLLI